MTKRDFAAIAQIIREHAMGNRELQEAIAAYCASTNPRFDRERFLAEFWEARML